MKQITMSAAETARYDGDDMTCIEELKDQAAMIREDGEQTPPRRGAQHFHHPIIEEAMVERLTYYADQLGRVEGILEGLVINVDTVSLEQNPALHVLIDSAKRWLNDQAVRRERIEALRLEREGE